MNREQQLRFQIRQNTEDSMHYAREVKRLEKELRLHLEARAARRTTSTLTATEGRSDAS
jgi:hypothetical protein